MVAAIAALLVLVAPGAAGAQDAGGDASSTSIPADTTTSTPPDDPAAAPSPPEEPGEPPATDEPSTDVHSTDDADEEPTAAEVTDTSAGATVPAGDLAAAVVVDPNADPVDLAVVSSPGYWLADTGEEVRQTVRVTNPATSSGPATGVEITSTVPAGLTLVSATVGYFTRPCTVTGRDVTCTIGSIAPGTYNIAILTLTADHLGTHTSTATALATNPDPDPSNNTASTIIAADPVELTLTASPETVSAAPGAQVRQTLSVSNAAGIPVPATGVEIRSTVPDGLTLVSATVGFFARPCTVVDRDVTCRIGSIAPGTYNVAVLTFTAGTTPGTVTSTGTVTSANPDPNTFDDTASTAIAIGSVDLALASAPATVEVGPGGEVRQTFSATNPATSPFPATGVEIRSTVPDGLTLVSATVGFFARPCTVVDRDITCRIASIAPGNYNVAVLTLTAGPSVGTFTSTGTLTALNPDPDPSNNTAASTVTIAQAAPTTDLAMHLNYSPANVDVGSTFAVPYTVSHVSGIAPTDVEVRFEVSDGLEIVQATVGWLARPCTVVGRTATCRMQPQAQYWFGELQVLAVAEGSRSVTATATSPTTVDVDPTDDAATVPVGVIGPSSVDVTIDSTVDAATVSTGGQVRNTLTVRNVYGTTATGVTVTATVPDGFTLVSATVGFYARPCTVVGRDITCSVGSLRSAAWNVAVLTLAADTPGTYSLEGAVTTTSPDPVATNDRARVVVTVLAAAL
ncbi:MAG: DUF11 domain-containing protein [Actinobacteria bacterium]|nr:DUF11 domain-containing protein [Actinomycetota bacterium]